MVTGKFSETLYSVDAILGVFFLCGCVLQLSNFITYRNLPIPELTLNLVIEKPNRSKCRPYYSSALFLCPEPVDSRRDSKQGVYIGEEVPFLSQFALIRGLLNKGKADLIILWPPYSLLRSLSEFQMAFVTALCFSSF